MLISRLLNQREGSSPFTLVLDTLEQSAKPLLREYIRRAQVRPSPELCRCLYFQLSKNPTIFLSFETPRAPTGIDTFIPCWNQASQQIAQSVFTAVSAANKRCVLIIDSLTSLSKASVQPQSDVNLTAFLMSLLQPPRGTQAAVSLVAVYHLDIPLHRSAAPYAPSPLSLLEYLATTIITVHSLPIVLAEKQARERSLAAPLFGLVEEKQGVLVGLKSQMPIKPEDRGFVLQLEHRRKSGRGVLEWYFLPEKIPPKMHPSSFREIVSLLDDHPLFKQASDMSYGEDQNLAAVTFSLGLTDRQRLERDGVVLPYFDAQKAGGGGEGGRILYDMGVEDDFDEEEEEI